MNGTATVGTSLRFSRQDHVHPSDTSRATSTHVHGNITNAGAIGSTTNLPIITTTSGVLTTGSFGTAANTFCQGNDARLSDTRLTTNSVTFNNAGSGGASGSTFNGSAALTVSYNTLGAAASNQGMFIGTTSVAINRASANLALTGISSIALPGATSGNVTLQPTATAGTTTITLPATTGTVVTSGDTGTVSTTMLANDAVTYAKIQNVSATDRLLGRSTAGAGDVEEITCTAAGRNLLDDADAAAQRTTLGLGTLATQSGTFSGTSSGTNTGDQTITLTGDVTGSGTGSFTTAIAAGVIVDADVNASAAIAGTKISPDFGSQNIITTGNLQGSSINGGPLAGMRNAIINGSFAIAQRGTSFVAAANNDDSYNLDRWYVLSDGNDIVDITQNTATVPTNGKYAIALDVETINKKFGIAQIIEADSCIGLIGNQVTLSFKARVSATTNLDNVKAAIVAWSGTADTVTSDIVSAWNVEGTNPTLVANATYENTPANLNLTTSYATYSVTATVDTASTKNIVVFIWSDVTTTSLAEFLYITDVQLEPGPVATTFERRPIGTELALCQRYYEFSSLFTTCFSGDVTSGQNYSSVSGYRVMKRVDPSVTLNQLGSNRFPTTPGTLTNIALSGFQETRTANSTGAAGKFVSTWTSDAEL
jgi:hypothetical protein